MIEKIILTPFQKFVKIESFSGILLFGAMVIAMIWANSPFSESYQALWQFNIGIRTETFEFTKPLILWINDGLMAIFFFLIGLEIKRELLIGELNSLRKATLPLFAAIGGMVFPLCLFLLLNNSPETSSGWGIPMATDIAFTLAILKILGNRVPLSLKIFLTAFAIVDDLGAVLIIAIFYSTGIDWWLILYAMLPLAFLFYLSYRGIYHKYLSFFIGVVVWFLFLGSGIHPTIAGVLMAFTIPIRQKIDMESFTGNLQDIAYRFTQTKRDGLPILSKEQYEHMDELEDLTEKFNSPLQRLEHGLHGWVAYFIMPIFAISNAGVIFSGDMALDMPLVINIAVALFIGKGIGITLMSFLSVKLKIAALPEGINFMQIIGVAILAGVGFTMSIFVANLAFTDNSVFVDSSKVGILVGSVVSGIIGYIIIKSSGNPKKVPIQKS
ncbi:Na+/H+ antiporter NhaA [Zobellia amurskyensis]|uniref:Na(+)/H(+) antiporter NhaA n=1 Tax=Zobellia amurskyensis TaxID=248905 RepID=A0A7X2ZQP9_9FLAO|nr:Na+/H+ antiporter NhaA [Zobellia amurskyensis]MUH34603.1 Na+/H+ antiporter NhaA [Zobellia amurskyensis]